MSEAATRRQEHWGTSVIVVPPTVHAWTEETRLLPPLRGYVQLVGSYPMLAHGATCLRHFVAPTIGGTRSSLTLPIWVGGKNSQPRWPWVFETLTRPSHSGWAMQLAGASPRGLLARIGCGVWAAGWQRKAHSSTTPSRNDRQPARFLDLLAASRFTKCVRVLQSCMPEGHSIHRIARDQSRWFLGQPLSVSSPQGRFTYEATVLDGHAIDSIEPFGKHLFYHWSCGEIMHVHLGLYGKFRVHRLPEPEPRGAVRLRVVGQERAFDLNGPNQCELIDESSRQAILARLGPDPLRKDADAQQVRDRISSSRATIGSLLLNQSVIAGVGNVYRAEALFACRIDPNRTGKSLEHDQIEELWRYLKKVMAVGVKHNRIITADPESVGRPRGRMRRDERLLVYKKQSCTSCGGKVRKFELAARTMYSCKRCQK